jgi:hypothetical protein
MKRCPTCQRTYLDEALSFCLDDGTPLTTTSYASSDSQSTLVAPGRATDPARNFGPNTAPTLLKRPPDWTPRPQARKRNLLPWILGGAAVLLVGFVGLVVLLLSLASDSDSSTGSSNSPSTTSSRSASMTDDEKHRLFQAASMTDDQEIIKKVNIKIGIAKADGTPNDKYVGFATNHLFVWALDSKNTDFINEISDEEKAKAYVQAHY